MRGSALPASLLSFIYGPVVYAMVLQIVYHADPFQVLLQGPIGWMHYTIAAVIAWFVVLLMVMLTTMGAKRGAAVVFGHG